MKILLRKEAPPTVNDWGFAGAVNIVNFTMKNGDYWRSGTACYRHLPSEKFIRAWDCDGHKLGDWVLRGKPETFIKKYYDKKASK